MPETIHTHGRRLVVYDLSQRLSNSTGQFQPNSHHIDYVDADRTAAMTGELRPVARSVAPLAIVEHRGRRSGRLYRTPVLAFCRDGQVMIVLSYGDRTEWVRNVVTAGRGDLVRRGRRVSLTDPRIVPVAERPPTTPLERVACRFAEKVFTARVVD